MNTNFKVIGLTRLGIKPESTAQETDALFYTLKNEDVCIGCLRAQCWLFNHIMFIHKSFYMEIQRGFEKIGSGSLAAQ